MVSDENARFLKEKFNIDINSYGDEDKQRVIKELKKYLANQVIEQVNINKMLHEAIDGSKEKQEN